MRQKNINRVFEGFVFLVNVPLGNANVVANDLSKP